ncbi:MAG TPA: hypothetical protein VFC82_07970 [Actinomycetaceae bacterium]|nr:hypothetical protein [Propionibacterium sp.]HZK05770.1 hypothetical protein [Actinomycetaceae bacterium]
MSSQEIIPEGLDEIDREFEPAERVDREEYLAEGPSEVPMEADPVDTAEQREEVELDGDFEERED